VRHGCLRKRHRIAERVEHIRAKNGERPRSSNACLNTTSSRHIPNYRPAAPHSAIESRCQRPGMTGETHGQALPSGACHKLGVSGCSLPTHVASLTANERPLIYADKRWRLHMR
jgi:hypothetical protein